MPGPPRVAYIDESGDIGLGRRSSKFFIVGATVTRDLRVLDRIAKRTRRSLGVHERMFPELKFSRSSDIVRRRVLRAYARSDLTFIWYGVRKSPFWTNDSFSRRQVLCLGYQNILAAVIENPYVRAGRVFIDSRNEKWMANLLSRERTRLARSGMNGHAQTRNFTLTMMDSMRSSGLQVTDFALGAVHQMLENGDDDFYNIIRDKVYFGRIVE